MDSTPFFKLFRIILLIVYFIILSEKTEEKEIMSDAQKILDESEQFLRKAIEEVP